MSHAAYMPDASLLGLAAAGDGEALAVLVARHAPLLYDTALHLTGDPARAADRTVAAFAALGRGTLPLATPPIVDDLLAGLAGAGEHPAAPSRVRALAGHGPLAPFTPELGADIRWRVLQTLPPERRPSAAFPEPVVAEPGPLAGAPARLDEPPGAPDPAALGVPAPVLAPAGPARSARRDPYRHLDRRSPLRVLLPLALVAALVALAAARWVPAPPATPTPGTVAAAAYAWPALPPRPTATATPTAPPPTATATVTDPPTATATATATVSATPTIPPTATVPDVAAQEAPAETPAPAPPAPPTFARQAPTPAPPPPPTSTPTAAPTATATPAPAPRLALVTTSLDLGLEAGPRPLRFSNTGAAPLDWRVAADSTWLTATPPTGTLAPGATVEVAVAVDRGALPVGAYAGNLAIVAAGDETRVPVTMLVTPTHTVVSSFAEPADPINAEGCAEPTTQEVTADVTGSVPPRQVAVYYALNGGTEATKTLTAQGQHYRGTLGPFAEPGTLVYSLVVTQGDGQVNRSAAYSMAVQDCPSRVHLLPVTLPVAQRFTLGPTGHNVYTFAVAQPGMIVAQLSWSGTAARLSTLLYGPQHTDQPYE
ncbi:MAG TPA: hypothetical protein VFL91_08950, partial [Thermomicrobiales bacterium]|nr:hypothetical protein [Thermomicrobiales bacterium]